jgi:hypothetical protein
MSQAALRGAVLLVLLVLLGEGPGARGESAKFSNCPVVATAIVTSKEVGRNAG